MQEETPFDWALNTETEPPEEFFLLHTPSWEWTKTDDLSKDDSEPFYDMTREGMLFSSEKNLCPFCRCLVVSAGASADPENNVGSIAKNWACLYCGKSGDIVGSHGHVNVFESDNIQGDWAELPTYIVVTVEK